VSPGCSRPARSMRIGLNGYSAEETTCEEGYGDELVMRTVLPP